MSAKCQERRFKRKRLDVPNVKKPLLSLEWELDRRSGLIKKETRSKTLLIPRAAARIFTLSCSISQRGGIRRNGGMEKALQGQPPGTWH